MTTPAISCNTGYNLHTHIHVTPSSSGWWPPHLQVEHHQCNWQQLLTTTRASGVSEEVDGRCTSGVFVTVDGRKTLLVQGAKVRTSIRGSWNRMQQQHLTTTTTDQMRTSTGIVGMPDTVTNATCVKASRHPLHAFTQVALVRICLMVVESRPPWYFTAHT